MSERLIESVDDGPDILRGAPPFSFAATALRERGIPKGRR